MVLEGHSDLEVIDAALEGIHTLISNDAMGSFCEYVVEMKDDDDDDEG